MKSKNNVIIEWVATTIAVIGAILNAFLFKQGFYFWVVSNSMFIYFSYKNKHWGLFFLFFVYLIISIIGILYWK